MQFITLNIVYLCFRDGKSRQFAFIGFRTEQEAEDALKYFNKSYLDTCRITCEVFFVIFFVLHLEKI